jgi:hypothetical protein
MTHKSPHRRSESCLPGASLIVQSRSEQWENSEGSVPCFFKKADLLSAEKPKGMMLTIANKNLRFYQVFRLTMMLLRTVETKW